MQSTTNKLGVIEEIDTNIPAILLLKNRMEVFSDRQYPSAVKKGNIGRRQEFSLYLSAISK